MRDFSKEYLNLGVQNVRISGSKTLEDFHSESLDAIKRAALRSVAVCKSMDSGLRADVLAARKNEAIWKIKTELQDELEEKVQKFKALVQANRKRLEDASKYKISDPVAALRREVAVAEARRQLENLDGPGRITAALDAAKQGDSIVLEALSGSLVPLIPSDVLAEAEEMLQAAVAPTELRTVQASEELLDEAQRVAYSGSRAIFSALKVAGETSLILNLQDPNPRPVADHPARWSNKKVQAFLEEHGQEAYEIALRTGQVPESKPTDDPVENPAPVE